MMKYIALALFRVLTAFVAAASVYYITGLMGFESHDLRMALVVLAGVIDLNATNLGDVIGAHIRRAGEK